MSSTFKIKYLRSLPTWFLTNLFTLFLNEKHPWAGRYFRLADWSECQTKFCRELDLVGWFLLTIECSLLYLIFN